MERPVPFSFQNHPFVVFNLYSPDFTTAHRVSKAINTYMGQNAAYPLDADTIRVAVPVALRSHLVNFMADLENLEVTPSSPARVVFNERTGTVVIGQDVRISTVAVSHGNLTVTIKEKVKVSQPAPFASKVKEGAPPTQVPGGITMAPGGQTVVTKQPEITVKEEKRKLILLKNGATIGELVDSLNKIGVTPRDLMAILQALKAAGALHAKLEIM